MSDQEEADLKADLDKIDRWLKRQEGEAKQKTKKSPLEKP